MNCYNKDISKNTVLLKERTKMEMMKKVFNGIKENKASVVFASLTILVFAAGIQLA